MSGAFSLQIRPHTKQVHFLFLALLPEGQELSNPVCSLSSPGCGLVANICTINKVAKGQGSLFLPGPPKFS